LEAEGWKITHAAQRGVAGQQLLHFAGSISPEDAKLMREAIEQGCEQVDVYSPC
jgi:hypothetical protein